MRSLTSFQVCMAPLFICDGLNCKTLSLQASSSLEAPFSEKEIMDVVFEMGCLKSPGSDGMTGEFYKKILEHFEI